MKHRLVLATRDSALQAQVGDALAESEDVDIAALCTDAGQIVATVADRNADVLLMHEDIGPAPAPSIVRELLSADPAMSIVLISREPGPDGYAQALEVGARGMVGIPLSFADIQSGLLPAAQWGRRMRSWTHDTQDAASRSRSGRVTAIAGARGGAGTSVLACRLAMEAAAHPDARVCLIDLDLQAGDVGFLLDVPYGASAVDLADIGDDVDRHAMRESMFRHRSGLHVLPAPENGERAEVVTGASMRRLIGLLKSQFDDVVIDCGSTVTDANLGAVELADQVLVATTPDLPSLRAAHRLVDLWGRVQARQPSEIRAVLTRTSRHRTVQPSLARRILEIDLCSASIPSRFGDLEQAVNTGTLDLLEDRRLKRAFAKLGREVLPVRPPAARQSRREVEDGDDEPPTAAIEPNGLRGLVTRSRARSDAGAQHVEMAVIFPLLVMTVLLVLQLVFYGVGLLAVQTRAAEIAAEIQAGSSTAAATEAGRRDLGPGWGVPDVQVEDTVVRVAITPPKLLPWLPTGLVTGKAAL